MECSILFWMLLISVLCVKVGNVMALDDCYWSGEGPICDGKCRPGETVASESHKSDGNGCISGKKRYCCKSGVVTSNHTTESDSVQAVQPQQLDQVITNSSSSASSSLVKDDCYWVGKSPFCEGSCLEGDYMASTSRTGNGSTCISGKKKYCCKGIAPNKAFNNLKDSSSPVQHIKQLVSSSTTRPMTNSSNSSCYWVGHPPICLGSCRFGDYVVEKSPTGDGEKCESGMKKYCCRRQELPVTSTEEPIQKKTVRDNKNGQNDLQVLNSISNFTIRPFQRRPTTRVPTVNSTTKNHLKIVKIKRKLVMSTPSNDLISSIPMSSTLATTSIPLSSTLATTSNSESSTLATTTSLLNLLSTSESTTTTTETPTSTTTATSSTFRETESTLSLATAPSTSTMPTTASIKPTTTTEATNLFQPFFNLPDVLPVPLIFRLRPVERQSASIETVDTSMIQSSTTSAITTNSA